MTHHPSTPALVHLDATNMASFGFARFHYPDEPVFSDGCWNRPIVIARSGDDVITQEVQVPRDLCIELSNDPEQRLYRDPRFAVLPTSVILDPLRLLSQRSGWNQARGDLTDMAGMDPDGCFLASFETQECRVALGSGLVLPAGENLSWIGMVLVHPEVRRQGIGRAIMERCLTYALLKQGYAVNGLDATPMGRTVYEALGYTSSFRIWRCSANIDALAGAPVDTTAVSRVDTAEQCVVYESARKFHNRSGVLRALHRRYPEGCFLLRKNDAPAGYVFSRPGRLCPFVGPLVADSPDGARQLLTAVVRYWQNREYRSFFIDTPEYHFRHIEESAGTGDAAPPMPLNHTLSPLLQPVRCLLRMYQTIDPADVSRCVDLHMQQSGDLDRRPQWEQLFHRASDNYGRTLDHLNYERQKLLPMIFGVTGPELG